MIFGAMVRQAHHDTFFPFFTINPAILVPMRVLIITQKVDRADPILGFFHGWLEVFAKHCDVTVLGQFVGEHHLPENVDVVSLEKEKGRSRIGQVIRFWSLVFGLRKKYDVVFVHMTPIWIILGGPLWMLLRKPMYLWYEARGGGWKLPVALRFVRNVFSASDYGLPARSAKHMIVGHGIDTEMFCPGGDRASGLIVTIGRITRTKHLDSILKTFAGLGADKRLLMVGPTIRKDDQGTLDSLHHLMDELGIRDRVEMKTMRHEEVRDLLQRAELLLHACAGGLDKVALEAMACGCLIVSTSHAAKQILPEECCATEDTFLQKSQAILATPDPSELRSRLRSEVVQNHSLQRLVERLLNEIKS